MALYTTPMEDIEGSSNRGDSDNFVCFKKLGENASWLDVVVSECTLCVRCNYLPKSAFSLSISFYLTLTDNYVFFLLEEKQHDCCSATYARNNQAKNMTCDVGALLRGFIHTRNIRALGPWQNRRRSFIISEENSPPWYAI